MVARTHKTIRIQGKSRSPLEAIAEERWTRLERAASLIRPTLKQPLSKEQALKIARRLSIHWSTVYVYRRRLKTADVTTAISGRTRGWKTQTTRLQPKQEQAVSEAIASVRRKRATLRVVDVVAEVETRCRLLRVSPPSRPAIDLRLKRAPGLTIERRGVTAPGDSDPHSAPGTFYVRHPLDVVQIDHTSMDIIVVDDLYRLPIGRPYLTIAMDVATRSVLAFVITFDPPSAATVALCLAQVVSPKDRWISALGLDVPWPMAGLPKSLHLDNAQEFKSKALRRGCTQYGIELVHRPVGRPHFGGHIERLIGTLMQQLRSLPGATGSSSKGRKRRSPEKHACLTLSELERWFGLEICAKYHQTPHRGLKGGTPLGGWNLYTPPVFNPEMVMRLRIMFLPAVSRTLRRDGLTFNHIRYWHPIFARWLGHTGALVFHYDPRDLSKLYIAHKNNYLEIPYADLRHPSVSLWEATAAARHLRESGKKTINEHLLIAAIEIQRELVQKAIAKKRAPKSRHQRTRLAKNLLPPSESQQSTSNATDVIDWSVEVEPYSGETW